MLGNDPWVGHVDHNLRQMPGAGFLYCHNAGSVVGY